MFFTASAEYLRWYLKDTIKRAKNISSLIFFTASAEMFFIVSLEISRETEWLFAVKMVYSHFNKNS